MKAGLKRIGAVAILLVVAATIAFCFAGCYPSHNNKQAAAKPTNVATAQPKAPSKTKTFSDIPTPYPNLYQHDPESGWLNVYDENRVIGYSDAYDFIGQEMTVECDVDSVVHAASSNGSPYFFNVGGEAYAPGGFAVVVWSEDLARFDQNTLRNLVEWSKSDQPMTMRIRISGTIEMYNDRPQIVARDGSQIATLLDDGKWFTMMSDDEVDRLMDLRYR